MEAVDSISALQTSFAAVLQFALGLVVPAALRVPTTFRRVYNKLQSALNGVVDEVSVTSRLKEDAGDADGSSMIDFLCVPIISLTFIDHDT